LIGDYAVNAVRNTVDMEIWITSDPDNLERVLAAIREFAFPAAPIICSINMTQWFESRVSLGFIGT